ncbi:Guanine nucleotide-binding protein-like 3, N-terminal domain protein [Kalmanozyma brasiliensis GHG001]|uniref:Guanine nucleotide-binding protein-like 3 N-terminal domain-containing protein n=1 Tax=Kalmanozyma brasiliensis (strain GHG001) TaxID=1365824 RepID=V5ELV7_KALBG|nr:Guanine nucleotide-binding protein-like 3, N-terminal domain protein [Kalmanozyma brasiliensis GHG001]EST06055.1 Guanine nucleotide-binding protein-like 3, N-terminal domain protein [Kalmanozyma brasiliensis GHG001]
MVKVKKRASKRVKIAQREKIKKKVKEHRRKSNRDERRNTQWKSKARKDLGIPNSFPYKEQLLNEIETKRRLAEEERLAKRADKLAERNAAQDADEASGSDAEAAEEDDEDAEDAEMLEDIPMAAPLFRGSLAELLDSTEIKTVVLALDARDPQSFRSPWLEVEISGRKDKKLAFALSRADMVPLETVAAWTAYLSTSTGIPVFPISSPSDQLAENTGAEALVEQLDLKGVKKGDVAVVGLTHSGRSTVADAIINAIGVPEDEDVEDEDNETSDWPAVLDTPALAPLKSSEAAEESDEEEEEDDEEDEEEDDEHNFMARMELKSMQTLMRNQGHVQRIKEPLPLAWALMSRVSHPEDLMLVYNVPAFGSFQPDKASLADEDLDEEVIKAVARRQKVHADTQEFLIALARATGRMKKRNIPDEIGASRVLLRDWSHQMLGYYTQAPKLTAEAQTTADQVKQHLSKSVPLVLARKEWRKKFQSRELRLRPISLVLGREALVLDQVEMLPPPPEQDSEEDEDEIEESLMEEDADSLEDDDDEEGEEEEIASKKPAQLKSILKKNRSKKRDLAVDADESWQDEEEEEDDEAAQSLSRKDRRLQKKARVVVPSKAKPAASKRNGNKATKLAGAAAKAASAATGPAPGEKYDFGAFF